MLILDNLLLSPLMWIFKEINDTVQLEQAGEAESVTRSLSELYMQLETGNITEAEFEATETVLLDRLDAIRERNEGLVEDGAEADEEDEEDEESDEESDEEEDGDGEEEDGEEEEEQEAEAADAAVVSESAVPGRPGEARS